MKLNNKQITFSCVVLPAAPFLGFYLSKTLHGLTGNLWAGAGAALALGVCYAVACSQILEYLGEENKP